MFSPGKVVDAVRDVLSGNAGFISLHEPTIAEREKELVNDCLDSGFVSSVGKYVDQFEQHLAELLLPKDGGWINHKTGRKVAAIVPMHAFGHPVDMDKLNVVAEKYQLPVVEDAAE